MTFQAPQWCERHHLASIVPEPCPLCEAEKQPWNHEAPLAEFQIAKNWPALARAIGLTVWPPEDEHFPVPSADLMLLLAEAYPNLAAAIYPDDANQEGEARGAAHDLCEILKGAVERRRWQRHVDAGGELPSGEPGAASPAPEPAPETIRAISHVLNENRKGFSRPNPLAEAALGRAGTMQCRSAPEEGVSRETDDEKTQQEPELDLFQRLCNGFDETSGS